MKHKVYLVTISENGNVILSAQKHALNSGIRMSEALIRQLTRERGCGFTGSKPQHLESTYKRQWCGGGYHLTAQVALDEPD